LAEFEQFEPERLDLRYKAEHGGAILERPGQHRLGSFELVDHRREGGKCRRSEMALDPHYVEVRRRDHRAIIRWHWRERIAEDW